MTSPTDVPQPRPAGTPRASYGWGGGWYGDARRRAALEEARRTHDPDLAWNGFAHVVAGMAIYGGIGWLVGRWLGNASVGLAVGSLIGVVLALVLVNVRLNQTGTNRTAPTQTSTLVQTQEDRAPMREVEANDER